MSAPQTLSIVNKNGNLNFTSEALIHSKASGLNLNIINTFNNGVAQIESDNNNTIRSINGTAKLESYNGRVDLNSNATNNNSAISITAIGNGGGININSGTGGITANSSGNVSIASNGASMNLGFIPPGGAITSNINLEATSTINNLAENYNIVASDTINIISLTGDINLGTALNSSIIRFSDGNVLINELSSTLDRQLDIGITKGSMYPNSILGSGYNGIAINSSNITVAPDISLLTSDGNAAISLGIQPASSTNAIYRTYIAYQTGTAIIPVSGAEFNIADIGTQLYWSNGNESIDSITGIGTVILQPSNIYATSGLTTSGTYTGLTSKIYRVEVDSNGVGLIPDTFKWSNDAGLTYKATYQPIVASVIIPLELGVEIMFQSATGNAVNDYWTFQTKMTAIVATSRNITSTEKLYSLQPYSGYLRTPNLSDIQISTAGTEIMRLTQDGLIGINQPQPTATLEIHNNIGIGSLVNEYNVDYQINPYVSSFRNGGYVAVWENASSTSSPVGSSISISLQRFLADGEKYGQQLQVNNMSLNDLSYPCVASRNVLNSRDCIVVWQHATAPNTGEYDIYAQIFIDGVILKPTMDIPIYSASSNPVANYFVHVIGLTNGNYLIVWSSITGGFTCNIYGKIVDNNGNVGSLINISQTQTGNTFYLYPYAGAFSMADPTLPGGAVVAFMKLTNPSGLFEVYYQTFNSSMVAQYINDIQVISNSSSLTDGLVSCIGISTGGFSISFYRNYNPIMSNYSSGMIVQGQTSLTTGTITIVNIINLQLTVTGLGSSRYVVGEIIIINNTSEEKIYNVVYDGLGGAIITLDTGYKSIVAFGYSTASTTPYFSNYNVNTSFLEADAERNNSSIGSSIFKYTKPLAQIVEFVDGTSLAVSWTSGTIPSIFYQLISVVDGSLIGNETEVNAIYSGLKQRNQSMATVIHGNGTLAGIAMAWDIETLDASLSGIYQTFLSPTRPFISIYNGLANLTLTQPGFLGIGTSNPIDKLHIISSDLSSNIVLQNTNTHIQTIGGLNNLKFKDGENDISVIKTGYSNNYQALNPEFDNLEAYYKFDESPGYSFITDSTANGIQGTLQNFDIINCWVPGVVNGGLQFLGVNSYVYFGLVPKFSNLAVGQSFSISMWFQIATAIPTGTNWSLFKNDGESYNIPIIEGSMKISIVEVSGSGFIRVQIADSVGTTSLNSITNINDSTWHNLIVCYDNSTLDIQIYIDGVFDNQATTNTPIIYGTGLDTLIGTSDTITNFYRGFMDEMRIYSTLLNTDEIQTLYSYGNEIKGKITFITQNGTAQSITDSSDLTSGFTIDDTGRIQGLQAKGHPFIKLTGQYTTYSSNNSITGLETLMTEELQVGDKIQFNNTTSLIITKIINNTSALVDKPTLDSNSKHVIRKPSIMSFYDIDNKFKGLMNYNGNLLISSTSANPSATASNGIFSTEKKLEIAGDGTTGNLPIISITSSNASVYTDGANETRLEFRKAMDVNCSNIQTLGYINASHYGTVDDTQGQMRVFVNNGTTTQETMTIKSNGRVGIGNQVSPKGILQILDPYNANVVIMSSSNAEVIYGENSTIYFAGATSSQDAGSNVAQFSLAGISGSSDYPAINLSGRLDFLTNNYIDAVGVQQRMSITSDGYVGVCITEPYNLFQVAPKASLISGTTATQSGSTITLNENFSDDNIIGGIAVFNNNFQTARRINGRPTSTFLTVDQSGTVAAAPITLYYPGLNVDTQGNVAIGNTKATSKLHVEGAISTAISTINSIYITAYTLTSRDSTVLGDCSASSITITLPNVSSISGRCYIIKKIDTSGNTITITPTNGLIDGAGFYTLSTSYKCVKVQTDGSNWYIIGSN